VGSRRTSTRNSGKGLALLRLRARIVREVLVARWQDVWFFPAHDGVHGWQGTQDIMFVGLNPSTGRFPSRSDGFLYQTLADCGFERAHLTDVIKERAPGAEVGVLRKDSKRMRAYRLYLRAEAKIVEPRLIVAMGKQAKRILDQWFPKDERVRGMPHYAQRIATPRTHRRFRAALKKIQREYVARGRGRVRPPP